MIIKNIIVWLIAFSILLAGYSLGVFTGHIVVLRDDGTICAEVR